MRLLCEKLSEPVAGREREIYLAGAFGDPELLRFLLPILRSPSDSEEELTLTALGEIGRRNPGSEVLMEMIEPLTKEPKKVLDRMKAINWIKT